MCFRKVFWAVRCGHVHLIGQHGHEKALDCSRAENARPQLILRGIRTQEEKGLTERNEFAIIIFAAEVVELVDTLA